MFELIARILTFFYSLIPSYGFAITMLTVLVMIVFMPITFRATKSMIAMRHIQPELKALQAKHADDKETLNREMMELYQRHGVNPVGGCLPLLFQAPVFYVLFRVVRGITRRTSDIGYITGRGTAEGGLARSGEATDLPASIDSPTKNFNPEYLDDVTDGALYQDLVSNSEMVSFGIDLSRSASEVIGDSPAKAIPYLLMVVITGFLSWFQQRQIQGRMKTAEMNPQMQMITKVMPWFLPIFAFSMPAALVVYFIVSALFRVGQQHLITRRYYGDEDEEGGDEEGGDPSSDLLDEDDPDGDSSGEKVAVGVGGGEAKTNDGVEPPAAASGGLLGTLLGGGAQTATPTDRHGSRRPAPSVQPSGKPSNKRNRPPRDTPAPTKPNKKNAKSGNTTTAESEGSGSAWSRAKRSAGAAGAKDASAAGTNGTTSRWRGGRNEPEPAAPAKKQSKRVTTKGDGKPHSTQNRNKKKRN